MIPPLPQNSCRILVDSLNPVLFTFDDGGKISSISYGCTELLGFLPEEMIGRLLSDFILPEDKGHVSNMVEQAKQGVNDPSCFLVVGKGGDFHPVMAFSRSVFEVQENTGGIGFIGQISPNKQAEKIVRGANTRIHLLNSVVRHDINNQLTVLNGYLSLMEQDDGTLKSKEIVRILLDAAEKIHGMVTFTSEYKDIGKYSPEWTNLYEVFQSALSTVDVPDVQIIAESSCEEIELLCDPMLIKVFYQLIDHSLHQEKAVSEISLRWKPGNGGAIIVYEDNGAGISEPVKSILFQPDKMKKNGYGLFLAREILAIFDLTITETGTPGKGIRYEIGVPAGSFRIVKKIKPA